MWVEEEDDGTLTVYHTESPFWYYFFHPDEGTGRNTCKKGSECTKKVPVKKHACNKTCTDPNKLEYWM